MVASVCMNHTDRVATARCVSCHKPVCGECVVVENGKDFCSSGCAANYAKFHARYGGEVKSGFFASLKTYLTSLIGLAIIAALIVFAGAKVLKIKLFVNLLESIGL